MSSENYAFLLAKIKMLLVFFVAGLQKTSATLIKLTWLPLLINICIEVSQLNFSFIYIFVNKLLAYRLEKHDL